MLAYGATSWVTTDVSMPTKGKYPRVSLLPDGRLFIASPSDDEPFRKSYTFDPVAGTKAPAGTNVVPESEPDEIHGSDQAGRAPGCCCRWCRARRPILTRVSRSSTASTPTS